MSDGTQLLLVKTVSRPWGLSGLRHASWLILPESLETPRSESLSSRLKSPAKASATQAMAQRYLGVRQPLYRYLTHLLGSSDDAEDVAQEVFVRVMLAVDRYEDQGGQFRSWVFTIARNEAWRFRERWGKSTAMESALLTAMIEKETLRSEDAGQGMASCDFGEAIAKLNAGQQRVVALRYANDLSWDQIAMAMDKTSPAVRMLHHRALAILRRGHASMRVP